MEKYNVAGQSPTNNKDKARKEAELLANDLMTIRLREGRAISELKEHKQRVMELETQVRKNDERAVQGDLYNTLISATKLCSYYEKLVIWWEFSHVGRIMNK